MPDTLFPCIANLTCVGCDGPMELIDGVSRHLDTIDNDGYHEGHDVDADHTARANEDS